MPPIQQIPAEQVKHVAHLARLDLPPEQLAALSGELAKILTYIAKISQADVSGIEPMAHAVRLVNVLRDDVAGPALSIDQVLQNAPKTDGRFFQVPKIIGSDTEDSAG